MSRTSADLLELGERAAAIPEHPVAALDQVCTNRKPDLAGADEAYRLHPSTPDLRPVDAACSACSLSPALRAGRGSDRVCRTVLHQSRARTCNRTFRQPAARALNYVHSIERPFQSSLSLSRSTLPRSLLGRLDTMNTCLGVFCTGRQARQCSATAVAVSSVPGRGTT